MSHTAPVTITYSSTFDYAESLQVITLCGISGLSKLKFMKKIDCIIGMRIRKGFFHNSLPAPDLALSDEEGAQWYRLDGGDDEDDDWFLEFQDADFFKEGISMLHDCRTKCVNVGGNYMET